MFRFQVVVSHAETSKWKGKRRLMNFSITVSPPSPGSQKIEKVDARTHP